MYIHDVDNWCRQATKGIKYRPDRRKVHWELYHHLEDRYQDFIDQGFTYDDAVESALHAMGDPKEIAPMLAAIHRPFWGYVYSLCKWVVAGLTILMLWNMLPFMVRHFTDISDAPNAFSYEPYSDTYYKEEYHEWNRLLYVDSDSTASADGYTFTVTDAAVWQVTCHEDFSNVTYTCPRDSYQFHCRLKVTNYFPWIEQSDIGNWFWAKDSLGNYYYSECERVFSYDPAIVSNHKRTGLLTYTYDMFSYNYISADAEWIELHYDRSGRDIVLRIDLTGGDK